MVAARGDTTEPRDNRRTVRAIARRSAGWVGLLSATLSCIRPAGFPPASAMPSVQGPMLAFTGVTVVDVTDGTLRPEQTVLIAGGRIRAVAPATLVRVPAGGRVVDARGKFLIPGLWDMHVHPRALAHLFYPLFIAYGVTGIRDAWSDNPLDTLVQWRREILAGTRIGPPRQILSGPAIVERDSCRWRDNALTGHICVSADSADAEQLVRSLKAAGADMIKAYGMSASLVAAARRADIPIGGHSYRFPPIAASDSGMIILDHVNTAGGLDTLCWTKPVGSEKGGGTVERCRPVAERFRRNNTWWTLTVMRLILDRGAAGELPARMQHLYERFRDEARAFWASRDSSSPGRPGTAGRSPISPRDLNGDSLHALSVVQRVNFPILAATDVGSPVIGQMIPGRSLHGELELYVAEGMTPLAALQSATLNPAKMLRATESLGTVAAGKLADLVLLDANPLTDITNVAKIRAVVADGRYFDRAVLDSLLAEVRAKGS